MTKTLSPTAQAVLDAANSASSYGPDDCLNDARQITIATLRAAADQVMPGRPHPHRTQLLAIADELEAQ
jgi:hypothetical protein